MSIKSTRYVTRTFAQQAIIKKATELMGKTATMSDNELSEWLEFMIHNDRYNFRIVTDEELQAEKNDRFGAPYFDDINNLPEEYDA